MNFRLTISKRGAAGSLVAAGMVLLLEPAHSVRAQQSTPR